MYKNEIKAFLNSLYLTRINLSYIEEIYKDFLKNPNSIDFSWNQIFQKFLCEKSYSNKPETYEKNKYDLFLKRNTIPNLLEKNVESKKILEKNAFQLKVFQLINSFRTFGHQHATLDPLNIWRNNKIKNHVLKLEFYDFTPDDFKRTFKIQSFIYGYKEKINLKQLYSFLKKIYCGDIGIEYMHILDTKKILWIQKKIECNFKSFNFSIEEKIKFLKEITGAEIIEHYLGVKFPGSKRFSLEGADVIIPMLKEIVRYSVINHNVQEIIFGMAHRGRLNVLVNVLGKNPQNLFDEFIDKNNKISQSGDVKYHQGFQSDIIINENTVRLSLLPNPSHLEIINSVVMGYTRAKLDQFSKSKNQNKNEIEKYFSILPITLHGDSAVIAQGIIQEILNMSKVDAYNINGTVRIIINNQIGFTTSNISDIRSTEYCTDIFKMIQSPIFHVNGDNLEAAIFIIRLALDFRKKFHHDVVIDLVCYRRHGHNETDDPSVTQPEMYKKIKKHLTLREIYAKNLYSHNLISLENIKNMIYEYRNNLLKSSFMLEGWKLKNVNFPSENSSSHIHNCNYTKNFKNENIIIRNKDTIEYLKKLTFSISKIPPTFDIHPRVSKIYHDRIEMSKGNRNFDWGSAETLAYASLLSQGYSIRLSGEDSSRGTFFHRHAIIYDQTTGKKYIPLSHICKNQGSFNIWDSVLSEEAALGFEFGYSSISKYTLVIWEAQFGDFANGAQIVIDQFISSSKQKWNQSSGLIMLLPHGYEGQGPEHSSARIERYLQLCAENNITVCVPSTPAQIYHILRKQAIHNIKTPLIIISPKSLLRHPMVTSSLEDFSYGSFKKIIFNTNANNFNLDKINCVIACTGKIYYDLLSENEKNQNKNIIIVRIEQLYPFPKKEMKEIFESFQDVKNFIWCQEEPKNQGAWLYIQQYLNDLIPNYAKLNYFGRPKSATTATGYLSIHKQQQNKLVFDVLNFNKKLKRDNKND